MDFGSKFVYSYSGSEEEDVSDDEYELGMDLEVPAPAPASNDLMCFSSATSASEGVHHPSSAATGAMLTTGAGGHAPPPLPTKMKQHKWCSPVTTKGHARMQAEPREESKPGAAARCLAPAGRKWRRADTNIVAIKFSHLVKPSNMHTGDAVSCVKCHAFMSHISKLPENGKDQVWQCEFCDEPNEVDVLPGEIPTLPDVTYLLSPAPSTAASSCTGADESLVVFCMDTSGSMCVSQEVAGRLNLKGDHGARYRSLNDTGENQWMPGQKRDVTYVTRLQGLQAAVDHQLEQLAKDHPTRRVALITFNSEVTIIGDGTGAPVTVAGDKVNNYDELQSIASGLPPPCNIKSTRAALGKVLFDLEEGGQTALGPALLMAIIVASKTAGSKVIMCTDGLANVGLGNLDVTGDEEYKTASAFYTKLGETARENGVTVSVLTIAGTECKLVDLGGVASATGGQVDIVDPLKLTEEFGNILANPVIATHVEATFIVHKGLYIRGESEKTSCVKREVGNVTVDKEITFEYGVRTAENKDKGTESKETGTAAAADAGDSKDADVIRQLPFQVQIRYTDVDGAVALRVLTKLQPVTRNRQEAEKHVNMPVVGCHAAQQSSALAIEGAYTPARLNAFMYQRLAYRNVDADSYGAYMSNMKPLESGIRRVQMAEASERGLTLATYEKDEEVAAGDDHAAEAKGGFSSRLTKFLHIKPSKTVRKKACSDVLSRELYQKKSSSSAAFMPQRSTDVAQQSSKQQRSDNQSDDSEEEA